MREVKRRIGKGSKPIGIFEEEAVSPIIATILMVAITVVLAATVYILVSYYTPGPGPLVGSLVEEQSGSDTVALQLTLESPTSLTNPKDVNLQIVNVSATGSGWTVVNATITNPDGTIFYMHAFRSSSNVWVSSGATAASGASTIESGAIISITFYSSGQPVVLSDLKVIMTYTGTTNSINSGTLS